MVNNLYAHIVRSEGEGGVSREVINRYRYSCKSSKVSAF